MAKPKTKKRNRVKGVTSRGFFRRGKWIWIVLLVLLLIPAVQVAVVRFVDPPRTVPMWIEQVSASGGKVPLRYHWIPLGQIPEMFLKHLWISEDQRFFQHEGFDWKEMDPPRGARAVNLTLTRRPFTLEVNRFQLRNCPRDAPRT